MWPCSRVPPAFSQIEGCWDSDDGECARQQPVCSQDDHNRPKDRTACNISATIPISVNRYWSQHPLLYAPETRPCTRRFPRICNHKHPQRRRPFLTYCLNYVLFPNCITVVVIVLPKRNEYRISAVNIASLSQPRFIAVTTRSVI
jgi:hypothetical protein